MKRFIFLSGVIALCLQACTSPKMSEEFTEGKLNYEGGNYKKAFKQLLPVAVHGKPEAQYAVGYMYYYGYGASQDEASGLFWMDKAAEQGYVPAIQALAMIRKQPVSPVRKDPPERVKTNSAWDKPQLKSYPDKKITGADASSDVTTPVVTKKVMALFSAPTEKKNDAATFSLQLMGDYDVSTIKTFQKELQLKDSTAVWRTEHNGKDWYILTYGQYASAKDAQNALEKASLEVKDLHPWVRKMQDVATV